MTLHRDDRSGMQALALLYEIQVVNLIHWQRIIWSSRAPIWLQRAMTITSVWREITALQLIANCATLYAKPCRHDARKSVPDLM